MEPLQFLQDVIVAQLHPRLLVVGHDFNFGKDRKGTIDLLHAYCAGHGIELEVIEPVETHGQRISSTEIRQALAEGNLSLARALMGHAYSIEGIVAEGDRRGRTLGFPTANLRAPQLLLPRGVYRGWASWSGGEGAAAINVGGRPTFGDGETLVEVHVLDGRPELYGKLLHVEFLERLRPEMRFEGPEPLKKQLEADIEMVRAKSSEFRVPSSEFRVRSSEFGVPSSEFGASSVLAEPDLLEPCRAPGEVHRTDESPHRPG
jgi:riboflavin kinase/FMN adenylyltransferase